jgi:beta-glucosidase
MIALLQIMGFLISTTTIGDDTWKLSEYGIPKTGLKTCMPIPAPPGKWGAGYRKSMLEKEPKNMILMFLGDSITMYWQSLPGVENGSRIWDKYYKAFPAGNYGISGDKTEHILWRITKGCDLEGTNPKVIVLLSGINNLYQRDSPEDTAAGIKTIIQALRFRLPESKILLLAVFPSKPSPEDPMRIEIKRLNEIIEKLADKHNVFFLDIGHVFLEKDGSISKTVMRDYIHLSEKGYSNWAEAMNPYLFDLIKNDGNSNMWQKH